MLRRYNPGRERLYLTYTNRRYAYGNMIDCDPSRFLQEIPDELFSVKREVVDFNPRTRKPGQARFGTSSQRESNRSGQPVRKKVVEKKKPKGVHYEWDTPQQASEDLFSDLVDQDDFLAVGQWVRHASWGKGTNRCPRRTGRKYEALYSIWSPRKKSCCSLCPIGTGQRERLPCPRGFLAAGRGKRLAPHTDRVPKPLLSLNGRPLLEYALHHLKQAGVLQVLIVVGYLGDRIRSHFGNGYRWGLDISYVEQGSVPGTGAAALLAEAFVEGHPFFLGWGDILAAEAEYKRLFSLFAEESYEGVMLLEPVDNPQNGAAVEVVDGRVVSLVEKSAEARAPVEPSKPLYIHSIHF